MSLPEEIQTEVVRSIPGLENAEVMRPAYAVEYDYVPPTQIQATLETKPIKGLFFAGQINGTTGYEEAAGQGMMAGINAALQVRGEDPVTLDRSEAYVGVLIDDLTTKGTDEPYRMFTSLAEYRLLLRQDNADLRLTELGRRIGLVTDDAYAAFTLRKTAIQNECERLRQVKVSPTERVQEHLRKAKTSSLTQAATLLDLLRRPELDYGFVKAIAPANPPLPEDVWRSAEIQVKYEGYIQRQEAQVARFQDLEKKLLPQNMGYTELPVISRQAAEKLDRVKPRSLGQASRIPGVSPADISALVILLKNRPRDAA
jgi:tRNA uridine 5-carboxymethylaminomethyl modification enzyme